MTGIQRMHTFAAVFGTGAALMALPSAAQAVSFTDTFDSIDSAWTTDRTEPAGFVSESFDGDNRLKISIDASTGSGVHADFYNTEGRQRDVGYDTPWVLSGDLYVDSAFNTTTGTLIRTDLWGRDSHPLETPSHYPIIGFTNHSLTADDVMDPTAQDREARFQVWDSTIGGWHNVGLPDNFVFDAWYNLSITGTGTSFEYRIDGTLVHTDTAVSETGYAALRTAWVQAYNYGHEDYSVYWDNISASVIPTPATAVAGAVMFGLLGVRRRRIA